MGRKTPLQYLKDLIVLLLVTISLVTVLGVTPKTAKATQFEGFVTNWTNDSDIFVSGDGLWESFLVYTKNAKSQDGKYDFVYYQGIVLYSPDRLSQKDKGDRGKACNINITIGSIVQSPGGGSITAVLPGGGELGGDKPVQSCSGDDLNEAIRKFNNKNLSIGRVENFKNPLEAKNESADNKQVVVTIIPSTNAKVGEEVDPSLFPKKDTVVLKTKDGKDINTLESSEVTVLPSNGPSPASIHYTAIYNGVEPGDYQVCSKLLNNKCSAFTKKVNEIARVDIKGDDTLTIQITKNPEAAAIQKTCESENSGLIDTFLCGLTGAFDRMLVGSDGTGGLLGAVDNLLSITPDKYSNENLKKSWTYFRNIASLSLVLIGLIMVIGQSLSKE